jgi:hypothetical protein
MNVERFEMRVTDRFNFQNGRTVFVGKVTGHPAPIREIVCNLKISGNTIATVTLEGEMMPEVRGERGDLRSVSTVDAIPKLPVGEITLEEIDSA